MAVKVNELHQKALDARKAYDALLEQQLSAKAALGALYKEQAAAETTDARRVALAKEVAEKETSGTSLDARITAARKAETAALEEWAAENERLRLEDEDMDKKLTASGRRIEIHNNEQDRPFKSLGEQLVAVYEAARPGGKADPRLYQAAASGGNTTINSDAGFMVQKDFSLTLMERAVQDSALLGLCDSVPVSEDADGLEAPYIDETSRANGSRFGGVQVFRRGEADTVTATKPKYGLFECRLEDIMGLAYATGRQLRDARATEAVITTAFGSEIGFKIDDEIVRGTGSGQMLGILNAPCKVKQTKETGQPAGTVVTKNLSNMWVHMPDRSKGRSIWLINSETTPELDELTVPAGTGAVEPRIVRYREDGVMTIKGRPVKEIEHCEALGTEGDIMLVDLKEFLIITKGGLKTDTSVHVRFIYDEMTYRFMVAINGKPKWASALTPYKGSKTRSPFITLETR